MILKKIVTLSFTLLLSMSGFLSVVKADDPPNPPDVTPPFISIESPIPGTIVPVGLIKVTGIIDDQESGIGEVTVNNTGVFDGKEIETIIKTVSFEASVALQPGKNTIPIEAIDMAGNRAIEFIDITWEDQAKPPIIIEIWIGKLYSFINKEYKKLDVAPKIVNGRTMVPLRFIAEGFEAAVSFESKTQKIKISLRDIQITLQIDQPFALVERKKGEEYETQLIALEGPPYIQNGRTMVPLRFIAEGFGATTEWGAFEEKITISLAR
jgi:hypothetical protein